MITFQDDMPVRAYIQNIAEYPYHWHKTLEITMVLEGEATVNVGGETLLLTENNIVVINSNEIHSIRGKDNKLLFIQIDQDFCDKTYSDFQFVFFQCCSLYREAKAPEKYKTLKDHLLLLVRLLLAKEADKRQQAEIMDCLEKQWPI